MSLLLDALVDGASAAVFAYVGMIFLRRPASGEATLARNSFVAWWMGLALITAFSVVRSGLVMAGVLDVGVHTALSYIMLLPLTVALFGLLYYLLYIHTGNARIFTPLAAAYAVAFVALVWMITWLQPTGVRVGEWETAIEYERTLAGPAVAVVLALLVGPVLIAALLYGSLLFRAGTRLARYRIGMTSGAFVLWFGSSIVAAAAHLSAAPSWPLVSRAISLVATAMILVAYRPPKAIARSLEEREDENGRQPPRRPLMLAPTITKV